MLFRSVFSHESQLEAQGRGSTIPVVVYLSIRSTRPGEGPPYLQRTTPGANENGVNAKRRETRDDGYKDQDHGTHDSKVQILNIIVRVTPCLAAQRHIRKGDMMMRGS